MLNLIKIDRNNKIKSILKDLNNFKSNFVMYKYMTIEAQSIEENPEQNFYPVPPKFEQEEEKQMLLEISDINIEAELEHEIKQRKSIVVSEAESCMEFDNRLNFWTY